jgi:hypothetical protein
MLGIIVIHIKFPKKLLIERKNMFKSRTCRQIPKELQFIVAQKTRSCLLHAFY